MQNWSIAWKRACRATRDCAGIAAHAATAGTPPVLQRIAASMHRHHRAHRHAAALLERRSCDPKGVRYLGSIVETSVRRKRDFGAIGSIAAKMDRAGLCCRGKAMAPPACRLLSLPFPFLPSEVEGLVRAKREPAKRRARGFAGGRQGRGQAYRRRSGGASNLWLSSRRDDEPGCFVSWGDGVSASFVTPDLIRGSGWVLSCWCWFRAGVAGSGGGSQGLVERGGWGMAGCYRRPCWFTAGCFDSAWAKLHGYFRPFYAVLRLLHERHLARKPVICTFGRCQAATRPISVPHCADRETRKLRLRQVVATMAASAAHAPPRAADYTIRVTCAVGAFILIIS